MSFAFYINEDITVCFMLNVTYILAKYINIYGLEKSAQVGIRLPVQNFLQAIKID